MKGCIVMIFDKIDELRHEIYESYNNGDISFDEMNALIMELSIKESKLIEERIETNIIDGVGFNAKYDLYHVSSGKFDIIKANSLNTGTIMSKPRMSSFWTRDLVLAYMWAGYFRVVDSIYGRDCTPALSIKERKIYMPKKFDHFTEKFKNMTDKDKVEFNNARNSELVAFATKMGIDKYNSLPDEEKSKIVNDIIDKVLAYKGYAVKDDDTEKYFKNLLKNSPMYLYIKRNVPVKDVGRGQFDIDEYTIDKDTSFDEVREINDSDILKRVVFVSKEEWEKRKDNTDATGYKSSNIVNRIMFSGVDRKINARNKYYLGDKQ